MTEMIGRKAWLFIIFPLFLGIVPGLNIRQAQATGETMYDYTKLPAFLETGLNPNLLLLIDNSKSMYDPAYVDDEGIGYCYVQDTEDKDLDGVLDAGEDINGNGVLDKNYDNTVAYPGYFSPLANIWYKYDLASGRFIEQSEADALLVCSGAADTKYTSNDMCITVDSGPDPDEVTAFAAKGRFLNWLTSSKFDIEKEILTGGKYDATNDELVLESRGCLDKRYIKKATVYKDGVTTTNYYATFAIRPPSEAERDVDKAYNSGIYTDSSSNTRIEIFKVDTNGFDPTACTAAIDEFVTPPPLGGRLGTIQTQTSTCLGVASESAVVFNQSMQECWFYNKFGRWQNPQNTVDQLKRKCEDIYNVPLSPPAEAWETPPADYVPPETLVGTDVCSGLYDPSLTDLDEWGTGYVGQCWEPDNTVAKIDNPCGAATLATGLVAPADLNLAGNYHYCDGAVWKECTGNYHSNNGNCTSGSWVTERIDDPAAPPPGTPSLVGWTDDADPVAGVVVWDAGPPELSGDFDGAEHCISDALAKFCENTGEATVVDPSDTIGGGAVGQSIPSLLIDYAAVTQLGEPLAVLKGRVRPPVAPVGLVHEFKYNLRLGAMVFNDGTATECSVKLNAAGNYVASLFDCLVDKETAIHGPLLPDVGGSLPDSTKLDGGRIIAYIDEGQSHTTALAQALNDVNATTWTPTSEAMFNAVGYYTQDAGNDLRINPPTSNAAALLAGDFIRDSDWGLALGLQDKDEWSPTGTYVAGDIVYTDDNKLGYTKLYRAKNGGTSSICATCSDIEDDKVVKWMAYDPVLAGCQSNNILLITDGASTADVEAGMVSFVTGAGHNDSDTAGTWTPTKLEPGEYECKEWIDADYDGSYDVGETIVDKYFGSTLLDDITAYGNSDSTIYYNSTIATVEKKPIKTHIVVAGTMRDDGTTNECNSKTILEAAATNGGTTLVQAADPSDLEGALRNVFEAIGGEVSSGSAASVISHSRSGEGAIYQAIFYPKQVDALLNEVDWTGDVHSLWLDAAGHIREDCGVVDCTTAGDGKLDPSKDYIIEFYTDASGSARARRFSDADGDGNYDNSAACSDPTDTTEANCLANSGIWSYADNPDFVAEDILLKDLHYLWSAANWLADASGVSQRAYDSIAKERYIFTMLDDSGTPTIVPFTKAALAGALTADEYNGYFNAVVSLDPSLNRTADGIVDYIRGIDQTGYRSREIDWTDSVGLETVKLGDIIQSTPTLVSTPAENYDVIYGDPTYRQFRKKHQYRRAVVYAGGNDGGLHAFNGGYYDRFNKQFLKAPPDDLQAETLSFTKKQYDLGAELWMYVPKNIFPHLRWLTDEKYGDGHVYYIDAKPYIFDAKIFNPDTNIHIGGWGTVLVAGMRYGGGNIGVNTDGVAGDDEIMRSSYFILDITDPEYPPVVLAEFTDADLGFTTGSPTAIPMLRCDKNTLAGIADCTAKSWPMDWYLAFGSGPHAEAPASAGGPQAAMRGVSDQTAQLYLMKLGGTDTLGTPAIPATLDTIGSGQVTSGVPTFDTQPSLVAGYPISSGACSDFTSANEAACLTAGQVWNPVSCKWIPGVWDTVPYATCVGSGRKWDYQWGKCYERISASECLAKDGLWLTGSNNLGICSEPLDTSESQCLYYSGTWKDTSPDSFFGDFIAVDYDLSFQTESLYFGSVSDTQSVFGHESHGGAMHRLVINDDPDPANWSLNLFYDAMSPVTAAPSVATDGERAWVYFGTGRLYSAKEDKKILTPTFPTMFLGLKEHYGDDGIMNLNYPNGGQLVDVTGVWVAAGGALSPTPITASNAHTTAAAVNLTDATGFVTTFDELNLEMDEPDLNATNGEKDIYHGWKIRLDGAERVIGQPAILGDIVTFTSYIPSNDPCLPEGDSYLWAPYFRTGTAYSRSVIGLKDRSGTQEVLRKTDLGKGLSTTPNIHTGEGDGSKAFVQSSTGAILSIEQTNPGVVKSGMKSWRELGGNRSCN
jgi:hypothetical protein